MPFPKRALAAALAGIGLGADASTVEEVVVIARSESYANNLVTEGMLNRLSPLSSVVDAVDDLPGVLVNEGDAFGGDDWSTTVSMRGFQLSLDEQQIGTTIDGLPNGNSNYGGGSKANRFIDAPNLAAVEVSQGTADIASRSHEALGGTLNFITRDPADREAFTVQWTTGDFGAEKIYLRYDTGEFSDGHRAWLSASTAAADAWIDRSGESRRDHLAAKWVREGAVQWTAYLAYDDVHEDNYQRVTLAEFEDNSDWDRLTGEWTGIPWIDQSYRRGWSTLRANAFGYLRARFEPTAALAVDGAVYAHEMEGRGDWLPPYLVDVTAEGADQPQGELSAPNPVRGGAPLGRLYFVDAAGRALAPLPGCASSLTFPYGGAGAEYDPACYAPGAIPVASYRHTHYAKERYGLTGDLHWAFTAFQLHHELKSGLWYEDYLRQERRDWHRLLDARVGFHFADTPYWVQYSNHFPVESALWYLEDQISWRDLTARLGARRFWVDVAREDRFTGTRVAVDSDSDWLGSAGLVWRTPVDGLELFVGYAENFAAIKDEVVEADASALDRVEPETAENLDYGLRYGADRWNLTLTAYEIDFDNRITFIPPDSPAGIDYLVGTNGAWVNVGGIRSEGLELALAWQPWDPLSLYLAFTDNDSVYQGAVGYPVGNRVFGSAEEMWVLSADWNRDRVLFGLSAKYVGERWLDPENTQRLDAYWVVDGHAGVRLEALAGPVRDAELRLVVHNLLDADYIGGVAGGSGGWLGAPRTATLTLSATF
ncbi:MAG: TonB-dependent receptor [Porticoccaceae bacterium]|nr:MAG: TonB-dependent receptor [Porticoccaceae bacterium]